MGIGETRRQRAELLEQLAILNPPPESVPINLLIQMPSTPLHWLPEFKPLEFGTHDLGATDRDARVDDPLVGRSFVDVGGDPCLVSPRRRIEQFAR